MVDYVYPFEPSDILEEWYPVTQSMYNIPLFVLQFNAQNNGKRNLIDGLYHEEHSCLTKS